jgi:hypothetical protein
MERIPDPPSNVPYVPATVAWDDHGAERQYTFTNDDGTNIMVPMYDPLLEDITGRHGHGRPDTDVMQFIKVFPVDQETYEKLDVVTELKKELSKQTGQFFEEATYYRDEAAKCYNSHGNPQGSCIDYLDDSKRIGSSHVPKKYQTFLCHLCPIQQSYINVEVRRRAGLYDPKNASKYERARKAKMRKLRSK